MKRLTRGIGIAILVCAGAASAAGKGGVLAPGGRTIAGPGVVSVAAGGTLEVFHSAVGGSPDACVTIANTGRVPINAEVSGATTPVVAVPTGGTATECVQDLTGIEIQCPQEQACSGEWRVDAN